LAEGRLKDAVRELRLAQTRMCPVCTIGLSEAYARNGMRDSAIADDERYLASINPHLRAMYGFRNPAAHRRLATLYAEQGDWPRAQRHLLAFIHLWHDADPELQPQVEEARRALARAQR